ncbi:hypothetical protein FOMG_18873 [Fusarium oxysporum f. sp. melonis 26406]|uniref:Uncharacterized protein n=1 Tax=Fusarium oxysporum f. sp. melonis 26406 TaxID=1089452 RepID=W9YZ06_FUSOX|nr:hypothetical protein FOMG_18873 [Fusarium oxysporum f. sp. melonis 26406]
MAKHQRRSHQGGPESNEILVDCTSESDIGDSPLTPSQMDWPIQEVITPSTLAHGYPMHLASSQQVNRRQSMRAEAEEYNSQDANMQMAHQPAGIRRQPYHVIDQKHSAVATLNTIVPESYHIPRQKVERPTLEVPYNIGNMTPICSSPASFSAVSEHSSVIQDGNYSHPIPTTPACSLQDTSSVKSQSNANSCSQQLQQAKGLQPENGWCFRYQPLVTGVTIGQIPAFTSGVCDMYSGPKVGFNDPTMQLPSSRVETY